MPKPNCYECIHRREVAGSAHSSCHHPSNGEMNHPLAEMMSIMAGSKAGNIGTATQPRTLNVKGNQHGIKNGWFNYPFNFDPTWLEECDGFERAITKS